MAGNLNIPNPPALGQGLAVLTSWLWRVMAVVNGMMKGKTNSFGSVTLTANAASTVLTDPNIGGSSTLTFQARTANAASISASIYYDAPGNQTVTIHHTNTANTDQQFDYSVTG